MVFLVIDNQYRESKNLRTFEVLVSGCSVLYKKACIPCNYSESIR